MKKTLKRSLIGAAIFSFIILASYYVLNVKTKSYSPEEITVFQEDGLQLEVFYNRPYKKNREIFGALVPYDVVWRTGANEATTFQTNRDILVDGSLLPAGKYTLWTIPGETSWKVMFNSEMYPWGITLDKVASRLPEYDVLTLEVPMHTLPNPVEQFTISFEEENELISMILAWDRTAIYIPIREAEETITAS